MSKIVEDEADYLENCKLFNEKPVWKGTGYDVYGSHASQLQIRARHKDLSTHKKELERMASPILKHFKYSHLPDVLQGVSAPICVLAQTLDEQLPDNPEKSAGLRKLLEAKDCFVRAQLEKQ